MLGLAIVNKQWALVAVGPVLLAAPGHRVRVGAIAVALSACFYAPLLAPGLLDHYTSTAASAGGGPIFQPWQLWWFLGNHGHVVIGTGGIKFGYRSPPPLIESIDHPLIVALGLPATLLAARRGSGDALLLLTLLLAARFALDTWDQIYYCLPFIVSLLTWETLRWRRPPVLALAASMLAWYTFEIAPGRVSPDAQAAVFLAAALPALVALSVMLYAPPALSRRRAGEPGALLSRAPAVPS